MKELGHIDYIEFLSHKLIFRMFCFKEVSIKHTFASVFNFLLAPSSESLPVATSCFSGLTTGTQDNALMLASSCISCSYKLLNVVN